MDNFIQEVNVKNKFYETPTGALISENDYSFLSDYQKDKCKLFSYEQLKVSGSLLCHHNFIQKDTYWKSCTHCGMLAPLVE